MVGPLMTVEEARKVYGKRVVRKRGNRYLIKLSTGKLVKVKGSDIVYHVGEGRFKIYSKERDRKIKSKTRVPRSEKRYRHIGDALMSRI